LVVVAAAAAADSVPGLRGLDGGLVDDDVPVEEVGRVGALDPGRVVTHERALVEAGAFRAQERSTASSALAHVVNLAKTRDQCYEIGSNLKKILFITKS
jgi:hypothetical protein